MKDGAMTYEVTTGWWDGHRFLMPVWERRTDGNFYATGYRYDATDSSNFGLARLKETLARAVQDGLVNAAATDNRLVARAEAVAPWGRQVQS